jgi:hypothetical protein
MNVNLSELRSKGRISGATLDGRGMCGASRRGVGGGAQGVDDNVKACCSMTTEAKHRRQCSVAE